jgi:hypothetical protein
MAYYSTGSSPGSPRWNRSRAPALLGLKPLRLAACGATGQLILLCVTSLVPPLLFVAFDGRVHTLVPFFPDDAFYYLQVAWRAAHEGSISFDGENVTTGFHPLFFVWCVLLSAVTDKTGILAAVFVMDGLALLTTLQILFATLAGPGVSRSLATVAGALPLFTLPLWTSSGLEFAAVLPAAAVFSALWLGSARDELRRWQWGLGIGMSAALVCLARLDLVVALAPFAVYLLALSLRRRQRGHLVAAALGYAMVVGPYCIWNVWLQGSVVPTSALVKLSGPHSLAANWRALTFGNAVGVGLFFVPVVLSLLALITHLCDRGPQGRYVTLLSLSTFLYLGYVLFLGRNVFRWYLAYPVFGSLVALVVLAGRLSNAVRLPGSWSFRLVFAVLVGACNLGLFVAWSHQETVSMSLWRMTNEINDVVPNGARLATADAGVVGYFGRFRVFNLDGLVNSTANWKHYLSRGDIAGYIRAEGVEYVLLRETATQRLDDERVVVDGQVGLLLSRDQLLGRYVIGSQFSERLYRLTMD